MSSIIIEHTQECLAHRYVNNDALSKQAVVFILMFIFTQIFSDEDEIYAQIPSSSSSGSGDSSELGHSGHNDGNHSVKSRKRNGEKYYSYSSHGSGSNSNAMGGSNGYSNNHKSSTSAQSSSASMQNNRMSSQGNLPLVYAPHSSPVPVSQQVHQFPCKYPGCNQVSQLQ